ncbi:MAG: hypothetical protein AAGJ34_06815 [Pseudomonadota bacterium]
MAKASGSFPSHPDLKRSIHADKIHVCSEFADLTNAEFEKFYALSFPGWNSPIFVDGLSPAISAGDKVGILYYFGSGVRNHTMQNCVANFKNHMPRLNDFFEEAIQNFNGEFGPEIGNYLPTFLEKSDYAWAFSQQGNWFVAVFFSSMPPDRTKQLGLSGAFGLDEKFCSKEIANC